MNIFFKNGLRFRVYIYFRQRREKSIILPLDSGNLVISCCHLSLPFKLNFLSRHYLENKNLYDNEIGDVNHSLWIHKSIFLGEFIDKYITINTNSNTVFTDCEILKLVFYRPQLFSVFCQSLCDVIHSIFISGRG